MSFVKNTIKQHPAIPVLAGFLLAIAVGTVLLKLPIATHSGFISWVDALFTSTSAVCVTGLIVVDTGSYFTPFGQWTILGLIQLGGLGVMTIAILFFQWIGRSISFKQRILVQDLYSHSPRKDIFNLISSVVFFTVSAELIGALLLFLRWRTSMPTGKAIEHAVFHSVSAFCNAGFSLNFDSFCAYRNDFFINGIISLLIILGGIGFPVLYELRTTFQNRKNRMKLSVQTKSVLLTSFILIVAGTVLFGSLEHHSPNTSHLLTERFLTALFQSITCRTAGFNTVDISNLNNSTIMVMLFLMFFGASPGSCGGGVKTTTLAVVVAFIVSRFKHRRRVNLFYKTIPDETVNRSIALIMVAIAIIGLILFLVLVTDDDAHIQSDRPFLACLFETVSAFGTVGLSMGITAGLSEWGKIWLIVMMIIGRIGVLSFVYLVAGTSQSTSIEYAEENVMIG